MGVELPLRVVVTILECCVTFSGVKLSIRSFVLFHKQSMKLDNYVKIEEWLDSSLGETTVIQRLNKKRPKLSN